MAQTFFRIQDRDEDPEELLDPERQQTNPWSSGEWSSGEAGRCDKCSGSGRTRYECESCRAGAPDPECPACGGERSYEGECPACRGTGRVDESPRDGVSVFPDREGLYRYMLRRDARLERSCEVELEGEETGDQDFDADDGALLLRPRRVVAVRDLDRSLLERLRRTTD